MAPPATDSSPVLAVEQIGVADVGTRQNHHIVKYHELGVEDAHHLSYPGRQHPLEQPPQRRRVKQRHGYSLLLLLLLVVLPLFPTPQ